MSKLFRCMAALTVVLLVATACRPTATDLTSDQCLDRTPDPLQVNGLLTERYAPTVGQDAVIDARFATFEGTTPTPNPSPIKLSGSATGVCMVGGRLRYSNDFATTSSDDWHDAYALTVRHPSFTSVGLRVYNAGDGIAFTDTANDFRVVGARMNGIHDDCIQNDAMRGGIIEDSFLECYAVLSARGYSGYVVDGSEETLTVRDSLLWARNMPLVPSHDGISAGHIGWFKFSQSPTAEGVPPHLELTNVTLRVDWVPLPEHDLDLPPTYRDPDDPTNRLPWPMTCSNVTIVWTGPGAYPGTYPPCVTLTTDIGVWNTRVGEYNADHPDNV